MEEKKLDLRKLFSRAKEDPEYAALCGEYTELEKAYGDLTRTMTTREQDIAWGFICLSDQMNLRLLELICRWYCIDEMLETE